jgi:uncharacterized protein
MRPSQALDLHRNAIRSVVHAHRTSNARVFGSVLHGLDTQASDLDILVDPNPETSLLDIAKIQVKLEKLLGIPVDVLTPMGLPDKFRDIVVREALPI